MVPQGRNEIGQLGSTSEVGEGEKTTLGRVTGYNSAKVPHDP